MSHGWTRKTVAPTLGIALPIALVVATGLWFLGEGTVAVADDQAQNQQVVEEEIPITADPIPDCDAKDVCGEDVAFINVINKDAPPDQRIKVLGNRNAERIGRQIPANSNRMTASITYDHQYVEVTMRMSRGLLADLAGDAANPPEVWGISVFGKTGEGTCYWDCKYVNGKKECNCIKF